MPATKTASTDSHIHLPSVHYRIPAPGAESNGFDYEENLYVRGRGRRARVERIIRLAMIEGGKETIVRETFDVLCPEELEQLQDDLPVLMDEGHPAANAIMQECANKEFVRQLRIAAGDERVCVRCGCSETRACSGGCIWATETLCSRCSK